MIEPTLVYSSFFVAKKNTLRPVQERASVYFSRGSARGDAGKEARSGGHRATGWEERERDPTN